MAAVPVRNLTHVNVIISDQAKALEWYQRVFGVEIVTDQIFQWEGEDSRWLTVRIPGDGVELVLMPPMADADTRLPKVGDGPMLIMATEDCHAFVAHARKVGVASVTDVEEMPWGLSTIVRDLDGNPYNVVENRD